MDIKAGTERFGGQHLFKVLLHGSEFSIKELLHVHVHVV